MMSRISRSELTGRGVCFGREGTEDVLGMRIRGAGESGSKARATRVAEPCGWQLCPEPRILSCLLANS